MRIALKLILIFFTVPCFAQSDKANTLLEEAGVLVQEKKYEAATKTYLRAANYFRRAKNKTDRSEALLSASQTYLLQKETFKAEQIARKILKLNSSKSTVSAQAYQVIGKCYYLDGQLPEAISILKKSKAVAEKLSPKNPLLVGRASRMIGATYNRSGQTDLALIHTNEALDIFESYAPVPDQDIAATFGILGEIFLEKKQYNKAISFFEKAIDRYKKTIGEEQELVADQFLLLGKAYIQRGNYDLGEMNSQLGLTIIENLKGEEHPERAPFLNNLGRINMIRGNYQDAFDAYYDALDLTEFHYGVKHPSLPDNYINIADVLVAQGKLDSALVSYKKALNLNLDLYGTAHPIIAKNLDLIAITYAKKGNSNKALTYYQDALKLLKRKYISNHSSIAKIQQEIGKLFFIDKKFHKALPYFHQALNSNVPKYAVKDTINAIPVLDDIFDINTFLSSLALKAQTLTEIFLIEKNQEKLELANQAYVICDSLIDHIRQSHIDYEDQLIFNNTVATVYMDAVENAFLLYDNSYSKEYLDQAFYFSEKSKSNVLLQNIIHDEALRFADPTDSLTISENLLKTNISFYEKRWLDALQNKDSSRIEATHKRLLEAKDKYQKFVQELGENSAIYQQRRNNNVIPSFQQIQEVIKPTTGLIDLFIGKDKLFIFGITRNNVFAEKINLTPEFKQALNNFREAVSNEKEYASLDTWNIYNQSAHFIYQKLLSNTLTEFEKEGIKRLIILPDGELGFIPFELLLKNQAITSDPDYTQLDYLIKDYIIGYDFSGSLFVKHSQTKVSPEDIKYGGFAPSYGSTPFSSTSTPSNSFIHRSTHLDLPASRVAVSQIADLLEGEAFLRRDATANNFITKHSHFDILHLAMHGIYDIKDPLNSHLVCAKTSDENETYTITASEIYNMDIHALLVVLGSCNSGYGKLNEGEGVMSISRAFAYAGCPSIIQGLWNLPDEETAAISSYFFQQIKAGKRKDEALRLAKLAYLNSDNSDILKERFHPFFWAGYVPVGDMSPLYPTSFLSTKLLLWSFATLLLICLACFGWRRRQL